ncbi:hypothetical protein PR048_012685 [Dryococelus australis]|uniref:Uncharacterized protein n=1 Tax=Dryococelus australis TaxID=614101 RepID=A0ABQ9HQ37_9NEOP|nr:hypothetical protein PR048_012685 [Dryococelus australis]
MCLIKQIADKAIQELEMQHTRMDTGEIDLEIFLKSDCKKVLAKLLGSTKCELSVFQKQVNCERPSVFHKFINGFLVTRCTNQYWAGLGCDLVINQTLMWSPKSTVV